MPPVQRREFLRALSVGAGVGVAGCTELVPNGSSSGAEQSDSSSGPLSLPSVVTSGGLPDGDVRLRPDGKVAFLNFFTTWCKPCQKEMPALRRLRAEYDSESFHMVSITPEVDDQLVSEFWSKYDGTWPVVKDPGLRATQKWDANSYPTNLLFDRNGDPATGDRPEIQARSFSGFRSLVDPLVSES